jgi:hypothetical protein
MAAHALAVQTAGRYFPRDAVADEAAAWARGSLGTEPRPTATELRSAAALFADAVGPVDRVNEHRGAFTVAARAGYVVDVERGAPLWSAVLVRLGATSEDPARVWDGCAAADAPTLVDAVRTMLAALDS